MTNPALLMLIERLLWPIPRVRWEAARSLARLIREKDNEAASALLDWIQTRRLESEVVLGLGIIDAFDLGDYFEFAEVTKAIRAPSLLSDFILRKNFTNANSLSPMRYARSPSEPATLPQDQEVWFDHYREETVSPIFSHLLAHLQGATGFPFMKGWQYEWSWLQSTHPRPKNKRPSFFVGARPYLPSHFHTGQREIYLSAYLRTLAFATMTGAIPHDVAELYALYALTMNRGLAELEPVERPDWAQNLFPSDVGHTKELAQKLWASAEDATSPYEALLALKVVDLEEDGFIEFDIASCIGPSGLVARSAQAPMLNEIRVNECPGEMAGMIGRKAGVAPLSFECPHYMTQSVIPETLGWVHIGMVFDIRLASPYIFGTSASVQCGPYEIRLEAGTDVLSRWIHWYSDWEPAQSRDLGSGVNSMTTVLKPSLERTCAFYGVETARLVRIRRTEGREIHREAEVKTEAFWM